MARILVWPEKCVILVASFFFTSYWQKKENYQDCTNIQHKHIHSDSSEMTVKFYLKKVFTLIGNPREKGKKKGHYVLS